MEWLTALGVPAILATVIPMAITRYYNQKDKSKEERDNTVERVEALEEEIKNIKDRTDSIEDVLNTLTDTIGVLASAQQAMLRDRIISMYNIYVKEKKYMPIYARESLDHMYEEYKKLGGNGVVESLVNAMENLPTTLTEEN